jgi:hypothetical protein
MTPKNKIIYCLAANALLVFIIIAINILANSNSPYFRVGPSEDLVIISTKIDTLGKYICLMIIVALINIVGTIAAEFGMPLLHFNIYNPDKTHITDFTKNELQFYANAMYLMVGIRGVLMTVVNISQIDVALFGVMSAELMSIGTIRFLLNEKTFESETPTGQYVELDEVRVESVIEGSTKSS